MKKKYIFPPVTIVVSMWNTESTIKEVLDSLLIQTYPISEIIVIDNHSSDRSSMIVKRYKENHKQIKIRLIKRKKLYGISESYNLGAKFAKTKYFVTIHSDSSLPSKYELERLVVPLLKEKSGIASFPLVVHPREVWLRYNFWQKFQFATVVGTERPSMNGKFDCYKRDVYQSLGGYDHKKFGVDVGSEDADMHYKLEKIGKVLSTKAKVIHLHNLNNNFSVKNLFLSRRFLAIAYGWQIRYHWKEMRLNILYFSVKPILALSLLPGLKNALFLLPLLLFPFLYMKKIFSDPSTRFDIRIVVVPAITIALIYYESFWMLYGLAIKRRTK